MFGNKKYKSTRLIDLIGLALRVFKVRPFRTLLTILGIGVSFSTIFFLLSLGYGLQNLLLSQISNDRALRTIDVTSNNSAALPLNQKALNKISSFNGVEEIQPLISSNGQVETSKIVTDTLVESAPDNLFSSLAPQFVEGGMPKNKETEVMITQGLASLLGTNLIGQDVNVTATVSELQDGAENKVVKKFDTPFKIVGIVSGDQNTIFVPFDKATGLNLPYGLFKVLVKDDLTLKDVRTKIVDLGYSSSALADTVDQANKIFRVFQFILALFGVASLVVAIIGMINTMTISLLERIHEIGVMKIFGITESDIKKLFYLESAIVGFLGGFSGLVMGYLASRVFNLGIALLAQTLGGKKVELFYYPPWFISSILIFSTVVGFVIGWSPARKASKLDPLKALNYK
jgi:ABC-type antimicrobial peptide transport system permease subunit